MGRNRLPGKLTFESFVRMIADTLIVNFSLLLAFSARLLYIVAYGNPAANINYRFTLWEYIRAYGNNAWLLTIISLVVFTISGFYTYGRAYRSRYKYVVVIQAVSSGLPLVRSGNFSVSGLFI